MHRPILYSFFSTVQTKRSVTLQLTSAVIFVPEHPWGCDYRFCVAGQRLRPIVRMKNTVIMSRKSDRHLQWLGNLSGQPKRSRLFSGEDVTRDSQPFTLTSFKTVHIFLSQFCPCVYLVLCETLGLTLKHLVTKKFLFFSPRHRWVVWVNKPFLTQRDWPTEDDEWAFSTSLCSVSPSLRFPPCLGKRASSEDWRSSTLRLSPDNLIALIDL